MHRGAIESHSFAHMFSSSQCPATGHGFLRIKRTWQLFTMFDCVDCNFDYRNCETCGDYCYALVADGRTCARCPANVLGCSGDVTICQCGFSV